MSATRRHTLTSETPAAGRTDADITSRAFQFGQKKFRFDSIRQSDKFAACTLIFE